MPLPNFRNFILRQKQAKKKATKPRTSEYEKKVSLDSTITSQI
ncbi:MAG: hypothetical protein JWP71_1074 [Mucilaginibacter sp.]|nr:hypothetical protein [Mucilaginibacter sp.]